MAGMLDVSHVYGYACGGKAQIVRAISGHSLAISTYNKMDNVEWRPPLWAILRRLPQKASMIVKTQSNIRGERRKRPDHPCIRCEGNGKVNCNICHGRGRTNLKHLSILPRGEWPNWCKNCGGSGLIYCSPCMGKGEVRGSGLIFGFEYLRTAGIANENDIEKTT